MHTIRSKDGTPLALATGGKGPPLLLVHGTTADHTRWSLVRPALEEHFTVYGLDRRGRGGSDDAASYDIEREFDDVAAVIDALDGPPVNVVAHSYGAICAFEAAPRTRHLGKLVLYEPPIQTSAEAEYPPDLIDNLQRFIDRGDPAATLETFYANIIRVPAPELAKMRASADWAERVKAAPTIPRELASVESYKLRPERFVGWTAPPVLLMLGGDSAPRYRQALEAIRAIVPAATLSVLPGQRHMAMNTAPALFAREVLAFLRG